ncbi:MAG: PIN domain-containing protein, partial [Tepidisphaeraceae bacterium]
MILVDTNVLIGLVDEEDRLHAQAINDAARLANKGLFLITPVLTEACFALSQPYERGRLRRLLKELQLKLFVLDEAVCQDVLA